MTDVRKVLLIRPDRNEDDEKALETAGFKVTVEPWLEVRPVNDAAPALALAKTCSECGLGDWLIVTSPRTWEAWRTLVGDRLNSLVRQACDRGMRIAVTGETTAASLPFDDVFVAQEASASGLLDELSNHEPGVALLPASALAHGRLRAGLADRGWTVHEAAVYDTVIVEKRPASADGLAAGYFDVVVVRSPSAVDALVRYCPDGIVARVIAIGPTTSKAASRLRATIVECPVVSAEGLSAVVQKEFGH